MCINAFATNSTDHCHTEHNCSLLSSTHFVYASLSIYAIITFRYSWPNTIITFHWPKNQITSCGCILDYLTWLAYEDWSVWNARALFVAVALAALHDTTKEHVEESVLELERQQKRLLLQMKQSSRWNSFLIASMGHRLIAILPAIKIAM